MKNRNLIIGTAKGILGATNVREVILLLILIVGRLKLPGLIMP